MRLNSLAVDMHVTEIGIWLVQNSTADARYQATVWGNFLDVRLFSASHRLFDKVTDVID
jgi:hypothetical protein